jgi:hypothetical protein
MDVRPQFPDDEIICLDSPLTSRVLDAPPTQGSGVFLDCLRLS